MDKDVEEALTRLKLALAKDRTDRVVEFDAVRSLHRCNDKMHSAKILKFERGDDNHIEMTSDYPPIER